MLAQTTYHERISELNLLVICSAPGLSQVLSRRCAVALSAELTGGDAQLTTDASKEEQTERREQRQDKGQPGLYINNKV